MQRTILALALAFVPGFLLPSAVAQGPAGNLLRNGRFQDDWLTLLPELKTLNWNYVMDFYHRRDFNPDGWELKGSWTWEDADLPSGQRRLLLSGPGASVAQQVNAWGIHDSKQTEGSPDMGGYPKLVPAASALAKRLLRDVTFRVRLRGWEVPQGAGSIEAAWTSGAAGAPAVASSPLPSGTFDWQTIEVKLPASLWFEGPSTPGKPEAKKAVPKPDGPLPLPANVAVAVRYQGAQGRVEIAQAELLATEPEAPNLLENGSFERLDASGYPAAWSTAEKYRYFPPGYYYMFGTWHNTALDNRGTAVADELLAHQGSRSLKMIVAAGDEMAVVSAPIALNQKQARLLEVFARIKTEQLCMMQIDAVTDTGERLDGFNFVQKGPVSIGSDGWRLVRTVFRSTQPVRSLRLKLCARGVNGHCLGGTGLQPQNNVAGLVWWDAVRLYEPETPAVELRSRGVAIPKEEPANSPTRPSLAELDLGERLLGENRLLATVRNPGPAGTFALLWVYTSPSGVKSEFRSVPVPVAAGKTAEAAVPYTLSEPCPKSYTEYRGKLTLLGGDGKPIGFSEMWFGTWTAPIDLELGAAYLRPEQKQYVRMNFGLTAATMAKAAVVRLQLVRRGTGQALGHVDVPATRAAIQAQRKKVPADLREDFANLLLADFDVGKLPVQPFNDPQRNFFLRATLLDTAGKPQATADSAPFCRLAPEAPQAPVRTVRIDKDNLLYVNDQPWMPWGKLYGFTPVYEGPADPGPGKYRGLCNLPAWSVYDRHGATAADRARCDLNCYRYTAATTPRETLEKAWKAEGIYCSTAFLEPARTAASPEELATKFGGKDKLDAYLAFCRAAPMVVSVGPGIEEAFAEFIPASAERLANLRRIVEHLRRATGKPVMVGHGGYWNRHEFEKVPFFDIYDPETEPFYPAAVHTDLAPLVAGRAQVMWLRPQMYESVPYERWRYHAWVELMRGVRGWQMAHGPGDASTFRGLHGEMEYIKRAAYSKEAGPAVEFQPWVEHWSRRHNGRLYIVGATTHGVASGPWRWSDTIKPRPLVAPDASLAASGPGGRARVTGQPHQVRQEDNAGGLIAEPYPGPRMHCIQWLPDARRWPAGSRLVQWVRPDAQAPPQNLVLLAKCDGRWTRAAAWGQFDATRYQTDLDRAAWFLRAFYRHASGMLGWDNKQTPKCLDYVLKKALAMGPLPKPGEWTRLETPLEKIDAANVLLDGVGFLHEGGRVEWGHTLIVGADGREHTIWGDAIGLPPEQLAQVKITVAGLKAGTKVRVAFEDRELTASDGHFIDDFRGQDLYERFGGGPYSGYGDTPVALHVYEVQDMAGR